MCAEQDVGAIADPAVIKPEAVLLDPRSGVHIGYSMRYAGSG